MTAHGYDVKPEVIGKTFGPLGLFSRILLGPFLDLYRFVAGSLSPPPPTRRTARIDLAHARQVLAEAGCDLEHCLVANLHTSPTTLSPGHAFDLFAAWQPWPLSAFFASTSTTEGRQRFAYRFYGLLPIVTMRPYARVRPDHIIYEITGGIGAGGFHSFLFKAAANGGSDVSIFTTFPPHPLFFEGLHDRMNADIFRQLARIAANEGTR